MKLFSSVEMKNAQNLLNKINQLKDPIRKLTDDELKAKTLEFKERLKGDQQLEDIIVEAFAVSREATNRVIGKWPYDVQILGGILLHFGSVVEMKTGEGKTIASVAPVYLNALAGKGVMVSTVNEYLTERDAKEMGEIHNFLGLTVGINKRDISAAEKRYAYSCDITYSVHSEIGFDYLRDNTVQHISEKTQRGFNFVLIDEVDSILIDEARTPLIISGGDKTSSQIYIHVDNFAKGLTEKDYEIDWEAKSIQLTDEGVDKANKYFNVKNIFEIDNSETVHRVLNALRANHLMFLDADYIIREGKIEIVDSFTGRVMEGRSFSDGLHQAIQAKERVEIEPETKTIATITYQNLFRMFTKLCGMSGTAKTEENEFIEVYNMRVHVIPTNKPTIRTDYPDLIFVSAEDKAKAITAKVAEMHRKGQPVLIGTEEVSESEVLSRKLSKAGISHKVLNAKQNESEAEVISKAGEEFSVTIATNMAGRGTDIKPTPKALEAGGLFVLGTNKSESRRIDNQLKGRSGRQGDIGASQFFLSLDDKLIARFSNQDKLKKSFAKHGSEPIKGKAIAKALNKAQIKIEGFNFDSRKNLLQYGDVIRQQRDLIYAQRDIIISQPDLHDVIKRMMKSVVKEIIEDDSFSIFRRADGSIATDKVVSVLNKLWFSLTVTKIVEEEILNKTNKEIIENIYEKLIKSYDELREVMFENLTEEGTINFERQTILRTFDSNWQLHIDKMTKLRSSTNLASYAQKNPYQVYVEKGSIYFKDLIKRISHNSIKLLTSNRYAVRVPKKVAPSMMAILDAMKRSAPKLEVHSETNSVVTEQKDAEKKDDTK